MTFAVLTSLSVILTGLASSVAAGNATQASCPTNPDPGIWHVRFGIDETRADGSRIRPIGNLADAVRCADEGTTIQVLHSKSGPLMGGVVLKDRQKLLGEYDSEGEGYPRIEATQGDALVLANENELGWLQIDANDGAAVFGGNVTGSFLHDLIINRLQASQMKRLDPSLCKPIIKDGKIDFADSVFRGCNGRLKPWQKAAITLVSDGKGGFPDFHHRLRNIRIRDIPTEEKRNQWDSGIKVVVAGIASVTVWIEDSYLSGMEMGIDGRAMQKGSIILNVLNTGIENILRDGIVLSTGFFCSGSPSTSGRADACEGQHPVPVSDAKVVLNAIGYSYSDPGQRGQKDDASAIEIYAFDQGRSVIELHVQDSKLSGVAQPAVFTFHVRGHPEKQLIDLGCRNPATGDPQVIGEDRAACIEAGYTSEGRNRIFGNAWGGEFSSLLVEVALIGPGSMMAQGNYWGDILPVDGEGDLLGECSRFEWPDLDRPVHFIKNARCELWNVEGQGNPGEIDGRFQLTKLPDH